MEALAILGGRPVNEKLPEFLAWPVPRDAERQALKRVLESGVWGGAGPEHLALAEAFAAYCGVKHALPVVNGTVSLELILRALGVGRGDEVVVSPYTFVASVHAIVAVGAMPVFADTDPETQNMDPASCRRMITPRTRAILGVHMGGRPFDIDAIGAIARQHGLHLIEDAAHAHGSEWNGRRVGGFGIAGSFSCQASKNMSAGEGGLITTNDDALFETLWALHDDGRRRGAAAGDHALLGMNARLAEWQCAILRAQLQRLEADNVLRKRNQAMLEEGFRRMGFVQPLKSDPRITFNACHVFTFRYHRELIQDLPRDLFFRALGAEKVCTSAGPGYVEPIYRMPFLYDKAFAKRTGREFRDPTDHLPGNERVALVEGCWFYHTSLLGTPEDTERILVAMEKVAANAEKLIKAFA
jgi:dTDP-4-amino-4,6-dideoxygalactose transaminase